MDLGEYGMGYMYWGTFIYDVVDGVSTVRELHEGIVEVTASGDVYTIVYENGTEKYTYTGQLPGLVAPPQQTDGGVYTIMPKFLALMPSSGVITLYLGQDNQQYSTETYGIVGAGDYFKTDIYSADGTLAPGTYTASAEGGTVTEGTFGIGWDPGDLWGIGWEFTNWGTCYMTKAEDGSETGINIEDGTVVVEENGGVYTITLNSSTVNARYVGPLQ